MRLTELSPRWLSDNVFAFLCPHCRKMWLTVKNVVISDADQWNLAVAHFGEDEMSNVVLAEVGCAWKFPSHGDFATMTVTPSLDASKSGHWHGFFTNGAIV